MPLLFRDLPWPGPCPSTRAGKIDSRQAYAQRGEKEGNKRIHLSYPIFALAWSSDSLTEAMMVPKHSGKPMLVIVSVMAMASLCLSGRLRWAVLGWSAVEFFWFLLQLLR